MDITKLKAASQCEMQNVMSFTHMDQFTINTSTQDTCKCQNKNETNITTTFTVEHDKL